MSLIPFKLNPEVGDEQLPDLLGKAIGIMEKHLRHDDQALAGFRKWMDEVGSGMSESERLEKVVSMGITIETQATGVFRLDLHEWGRSPVQVFGGVPVPEWAAVLDDMELDDRLRGRPPRVERGG